MQMYTNNALNIQHRTKRGQVEGEGGMLGIEKLLAESRRKNK